MMKFTLKLFVKPSAQISGVVWKMPTYFASLEVAGFRLERH
jgi:hypothetical protein